MQMSENCYKKNMLLKEKEKKYRVLAVEKEKVSTYKMREFSSYSWLLDLYCLELFQEDW